MWVVSCYGVGVQPSRHSSWYRWVSGSLPLVKSPRFTPVDTDIAKVVITHPAILDRVRYEYWQVEDEAI